MGIIEILDSDNDCECKVNTVASIVKKVQEAYGNLDAVIPMPDVHTASGILPMSALSYKDKVAIARQEITKILHRAIEESRHVDGVNVDKSVQALIATNPKLVHLGTKVSYGVL